MSSFDPDKNLPGCMMPDGGECCEAYAALYADWKRLRASKTSDAQQPAPHATGPIGFDETEEEYIARLEAETTRLRNENSELANRVLALRASNRVPSTEAPAAQQQDTEQLRKGLTAAVRAANLALFVIRKQGVMPNSSWETGFEGDMKVARDALCASNRDTSTNAAAPDIAEMTRIIASNNDCDKECAVSPSGCGCAKAAAEAIASVSSTNKAPVVVKGLVPDPNSASGFSVSSYNKSGK
jgi:hypothetical protein